MDWMGSEEDLYHVCSCQGPQRIGLFQGFFLEREWTRELTAGQRPGPQKSQLRETKSDLSYNMETSKADLWVTWISSWSIRSMDNRENLTWHSQHIFVFLEVVVFRGIFICLSKDEDLTWGLFLFCPSLQRLMSLSHHSSDLGFLFLSIWDRGLSCADLVVQDLV